MITYSVNLKTPRLWAFRELTVGDTVMQEDGGKPYDGIMMLVVKTGEDPQWVGFDLKTAGRKPNLEKVNKADQAELYFKVDVAISIELPK